MMNENLNKQELMLENGSTKNKLYSLLDPKYILILLPLLFVVAFAFIPMIKLFKLSFIDQNGFTLQYLSQVFTQKIYMKVILLT